jgi:hypothetical protein
MASWRVDGEQSATISAAKLTGDYSAVRVVIRGTTFVVSSGRSLRPDLVQQLSSAYIGEHALHAARLDQQVAKRILGPVNRISRRW